MAALKKNVAYNVLLSVSQLVFPLVTFPYASRVLGAASMGAVNFADSFVSYFLIIAGLGIPLYGVREVAKAKHQPPLLGKVFSELFTIHLFTSCASAILLLIASWYLNRLQANLALYHIGILILLGNVMVAEWFFQGLEEFRYLTIRTVLIRLLTIPLLFFLVKGPQDQHTYYGLNLLVILGTGLSNVVIIRKRVKMSFVCLELKKHIKPLLLIFGGILASTTYMVFDTIILGFLTDDRTVAYYSAAMRITKISLSIMAAVSLTLLPRLSQVFLQSDRSVAEKLLDKSMGFVVWWGLPLALGICCLSEEIVVLFAGSAFMPAAYSLRILAILIVVIGFAQVFAYQILLPLKQEKKLLYAAIVGAFISLMLNFTLIPLWGHRGAAISALTTEVVVTAMLFHFASKQIKINIPLRVSLKTLFTSSFFFVFRYLILQFVGQPLVVLAFTVALSAIFYVGMQLFVWKNRQMVGVFVKYWPLKFLKAEK